MKLILSLSVLAVALLMVLEGPAPAQADSGITDDLNPKTLLSTVEKTLKKAMDNVKNSDIWHWFSERFRFREAKESIKSAVP